MIAVAKASHHKTVLRILTELGNETAKFHLITNKNIFLNTEWLLYTN